MRASPTSSRARKTANAFRRASRSLVQPFAYSLATLMPKMPLPCLVSIFPGNLEGIHSTIRTHLGYFGNANSKGYFRIAASRSERCS
jgi:hypothetical protein